MAISPLNDRLEQMLPDAPATPTPPEPNAEIGDISNSEAITIPAEGVQVAGLGPIIDLIKSGGKMVREGQAAKKSREATQRAVEAIPTATPPAGVTPAKQPPTPPVAAPAAPKPATPRADAVTGQVQKLQNQLTEIENTIEAAPSTGAPPDTLINLDRMDGPADFKQTVLAMVQSSGVSTQHKTWDSLLADVKGRNLGGDLVQDLEAMRSKYDKMPDDLVYLRIGSHVNAKQFWDLARQAYVNPDNTELQARLLKLLSRQNVLFETYKLIGTRGAQTTAAGRMQITEGMANQILANMDIKIPAVGDAEMKAMLENPQVSQGLKDLVQAFVQLTEDGAREGLLNKVSRTGLIRDLWDRTWKNGLLSATGTHVVNLTANTTFLASTVATRAIAGAIGSGKRAMGMGGEVEMGEAGALVAGMVSAFREGLSLGWQALKTGTTREMREGVDILGDGGQRLEGQYQIFDARNYGLETEWLIKGINGYANFVTLLGGRPIMAMDEVFKTMGYRAELYAQAYRAQADARRAAVEAGKTADEAEVIGLNRMAEILSDPPSNIEEAATDFSQMITFSRKLSGASAQIQDLAQSNLLGKLLMPFVKTPIWVTSESLQHSWLAPLSSQWRADMGAGGAKAELAMAKFGMGATLMLGVGSYVADGRMTGGGPGDTNLRRIYMESGWRPYSFVFKKEEWDNEFVDYLRSMKLDPSISTDGRLYVPYRGIDPISGPLAMMSDAVEYGRYEDNEDAVGQVVLGAVFGLYNYVGQLPVMTPISALAGAFSQTIPNPKVAFKEALNQIASTTVQFGIEGSPVGVFSGARAMIERGMDNTRRVTSASPELPTVVKGFYEGFNKVLAKTPFLSDSLPAQYDYLGEVMTDVDPANPWLASTTGIRFSNDKQRPADKVMIALKMSIKKPDANLEYKGIRVKLEPEEHSYMMSQLGKIVAPTGELDAEGKPRMGTVADSIEALAKKSAFQALPLDAQQTQVRELYGKFTKAAQADLLQNSKFSDDIQFRIQRAADRRPDVGIYAR